MKTRSKRKPKYQSNRTDVYTQISEAIIERLEAGVAPWRSPYLARFGVPQNYSSGKAYSGINVFLLAMRGYESPYFLTYRQAQEMGGQVRKGEKGAMIVKAGTFIPKEQGQSANSATSEEESKRTYLKRYTVFNAAQIDGIDFPAAQPRERDDAAAIAAADEITQNMPNPPAIKEGAYGSACYIPAADLVQIPRRSLIASDAEYYSTLFHELTHATGHQSRLDRQSLTAPVSILSEGEDKKTYSKEELLAEMGSGFLCALAGIEADTLDNSTAYIQNWLTVLKAKDNRRWLVSAAAGAQKAVDYILGRVSPHDKAAFP